MDDLKPARYAAREFEILKSAFGDWEEVLKNPGDIRLEILHAGDVSGTVHKMINLDDAQKAEIADAKLRAPLFAHLIRHERYGDFLVDTGFDSEFSKNSWGHFEGSQVKTLEFGVEPGHGIDEVLGARNIRLKGVFCTHFHEHQGGAPSLPHDIPFVYGKGEEELNAVPYVYARFLKDKTDIREIDFEKAEDMPLAGKSVDIFGDGSFWAISTPGHTEGHTSYLVNGGEGQYMITGDICMCIKGFEMGIESGYTYAKHPDMNTESFFRIKKLLERYPQIKPVFGHESEEFRMEYLP